MMIHKEYRPKAFFIIGLETKLLHVMLNVGIDNKFEMLKAAASVY
jgi:hypothetical protein